MENLVNLLEQALILARHERNDATINNDAELMRLFSEDIDNCNVTLGRSYERESDIEVVLAKSYKYLQDNGPFSEDLENFVSTFVPDHKTFKQRRRASEFFLERYEFFTDKNTKNVVKFAETFLDECANRRGVRIALNGGIPDKPQSVEVLPNFGRWDLSNGEGLGRLMQDNGLVYTLRFEESVNGAELEFLGNQTASRQVPLSQSYCPEVAGADIVRGSFRWNAGEIGFSLTPNREITNPKMYIEGLGDSFWNISQHTAYSSKISFNDMAFKLTGGPHFIVDEFSAYRSQGGNPQGISRATDDDSGEAAGWVEIIGTFGPDNPIRFYVSKSDKSPQGRGNDLFGFTMKPINTLF